MGGELGSVEERRLSSRENVYSCSVTMHLVNLYGAGRRESWERGGGLVSKFYISDVTATQFANVCSPNTM